MVGCEGYCLHKCHIDEKIEKKSQNIKSDQLFAPLSPKLSSSDFCSVCFLEDLSNFFLSPFIGFSHFVFTSIFLVSYFLCIHVKKN